jgi:mannose-6-phosphate isomerase-like protein (cupin superfamily)
MAQRRVVAANQGGKSIVTEDRNDLTNAFSAIPGFNPVVLWKTAPTPALKPEAAPKPGHDVVPAAGGTTLFIVTFPPDSVMMSASFDPAAAGEESMQRLPGLAETFEMENPGMHRTATVDYDIVLEGEIWVEFDDSKEVHLKAGDVLVQHGTRHAWRNKGKHDAKLAFVLIGAN